MPRKEEDSLGQEPTRQGSQRGRNVLLLAGGVGGIALLGIVVFMFDTSPPDAAAIKAIMTAEQLALGGPIVNDIGIVLVPFPAGEFTMGSPASEVGRDDHDETRHRVQITKAFYLSAYEVTQDQYERVMGKNPSDDKGANKPVETVSWNDAVEFCRKLSAQEGEEYRLPTEAEWEYACRAGTTTAYSFGYDAYRLSDYAWYSENSGSTPHAVGLKLPNAWGLYDMYGNVLEWCQDWHGSYGKETVVIDPTGPASGEHRVLRGGSFVFPPGIVRSAVRAISLPDHRSVNVGFRLARTYDLSP